MVRIGNRDERGRYELDGMGVFGIYYQHKKDQFVQIDAAAVWPAIVATELVSCRRRSELLNGTATGSLK